MTVALISDIHANLPALESVLEDIDRRRPDMVFCLGDLVGYAPWPNEVVAMIRARGIPTIAGNYDEGVGWNSDDCGCAYSTEEDRARGVESITYTNQQVTEETRAYLRSLPRHLRIERGNDERKQSILLAHGSPRRINEYLFADRPEASIHRMMSEARTNVLAVGHTHKPYHRALSYTDAEQQGVRHLINTGSVGKPKDGDSRACYAVLQWQDGMEGPEAISIEFVRVAYDVERAAKAIERSVLPSAFAMMLREAR